MKCPVYKLCVICLQAVYNTVMLPMTALVHTCYNVTRREGTSNSNSLCARGGRASTVGSTQMCGVDGKFKLPWLQRLDFSFEIASLCNFLERIFLEWCGGPENSFCGFVA